MAALTSEYVAQDFLGRFSVKHTTIPTGNVCGYRRDLLLVSDSLLRHTNAWGTEDLDLLDAFQHTNQYSIVR